MTTRPLQPLWKAAKDALETANVVIFLGYSFPPSDALAREEIWSAIAANATSQLQRIDIVLGEDLNAPRSRRMMSLAESCKVGTRRNLPSDIDLHFHDLRFYADANDRFLQIEHLPLRAEDYLDVHHRLFDGFKWPKRG